MGATSAAAPRRLRALDALRGLSVLLMVGFHTMYDIVYLYGVNVPWFTPLVESAWRAATVLTFLFIAGWMCNCSRNNFRRAARYLAVALAIFAVTSLVRVDVPISFGIIFCMGASTLLYGIAERLLPQACKPQKPATSFIAAILWLLLFLLTTGVPARTFGLGGWTVGIPAWPYESGWLSWLGFPSPTFVSGDYYPLIPFSFMFFTGAHIGNALRDNARAHDILARGCTPLELIGRHALLIYVLHQPVILAVLHLILGQP